MKKIIAQISPNNELQIRYVDRPDCLPSKQLGDNLSKKAETNVARFQQKIEDIDKVIRASVIEEEHICPIHTIKTKQLELLIDDNERSKEAVSVEYATVKSCRLNSGIEYYDINDGRMQRVSAGYYELCSQRATYLDIIKKSQHVERRERCWGKKQGKKRFTTNARKKILCAGAVIDAECDIASTYEVTTTIPGDGIDVFDVVARWSGWIINRQTQIIRRLEAKGYEVYWFFCWEHQKRGALHQHWCVSVKGNPELTKKLGEKIRDKWFDLLIELSEKENVDLFRRKGILGTWRHNPEVWQARVMPITKSVAAYFSKYCSKNYETSRFNDFVRRFKEKRESSNIEKDGKPRGFTLYPSRYWGSGYRVKHGIDRRSRTLSINVANRKEGDLLCKSFEELLNYLSSELSRFERDFKVVESKNGFIYAKGFNKRIWFDSGDFEVVFAQFDSLCNGRAYEHDGMAVYADIVSRIASMQ